MENSQKFHSDELATVYAQQPDESRSQWEERILARGRRVYEEFQPEVKEWLEEHV